MKSNFELCLLLLTLCRPSCPAATIYVTRQSSIPSPDGASWATAFPTVQQGIDAAQAGDEVWAAAGTYPENITLKSGVGLYGGFVGNEQSRDPRSPRVNVSLLDGQSKGTVIIIAANATSATVVDGFDIEHGSGPIANGLGAAGGIYVGTGGTPIISNNTISNCSARADRTIPSAGGGIFVDKGAMPLIAGNSISYNYAMFGGGIAAYGGLIRDNVFYYNGAVHSYLTYGAGGALDIVGGPTVVVHNIFEGNSCLSSGGGGGAINCGGDVVMDNAFVDNIGDYGGALQCTGNPTVVRNAFLDTTAGYAFFEVMFSGGVFSDNLIAVRGACAIDFGLTGPGNTNGAEPVITNNTIIHLGTGGDFATVCDYRHGETPVFSNNIITGWDKAGWMDTQGVPPVFTTNHNNIFGNSDNTLPFPGATQIGAAGNISLDPLFVDGAGGDYRLQAGSPCIDAGNDAYIASDARDYAGAPRIAGAHVDIGAYEYGSPAYTMLDAAEVLRIAAGISVSTPANVSRLDLVQETPGTTRLTVADATRIAQWLLN
ncbi:MAG TPA: right-handed parallel beta-helix repeat-containing protein [Armatimonadota bacterium]|jgi:hypothetical protein